VKARRGRSPRVAALVATVLVVLGFAGLAVADASQLAVASNSLFLQNDARCTNATIATTGFASGGPGTTWDRVRLVGVPDACAGLPIELVVYRIRNGNTTVRAIGSGTAAAGLVDVVADRDYDSTRVTGVALLIGGWGVPTTWTSGGTVIGVISLRSFQDGEYVTAGGTTSPLIANSTTIGNNQEFDLITNSDGTVSLRAYSNSRYVTVSGTNSQLYASSTSNGTSQRFNLITNPDGTIALQSLDNDMYVCAENAGASPLVADRTWIREWEEFYLVID
jgi:hypothetical protein